MWRYTVFVICKSERDDLGSVTRLKGTDDSRVHGLDMGRKVGFKESKGDVGQTTRILVTREVTSLLPVPYFSFSVPLLVWVSPMATEVLKEFLVILEEFRLLCTVHQRAEGFHYLMPAMADNEVDFCLVTVEGPWVAVHVKDTGG